MNDEKGELKHGKIRSGVVYEGKFYEFGTIEYKNLMLIEGKKEDKKDTLLGIFSALETESPDNITEQN